MGLVDAEHIKGGHIKAECIQADPAVYRQPNYTLQQQVAKAQLILEYLKVTSFSQDSGLMIKDTVERRERLGQLLEEIIQGL